MSERDDLLETCLARLAAGKSVSDCLADYPDDAVWLRPLLTAASQLHTLSPQQPHPTADQSIHHQLRQAVRQLPVVAPQRRPWVQFMEDSMNQVSRFLFEWLPRVVLGERPLPY